MSELGPLNLADADLRGFDAVEPGKYNAEVFEITTDAVKNETGKLPVGTPMVKVQFRLLDEEVENRRVFTNYYIPPEGYDEKKRQMMLGMLARFFIATGDSEESVKNKKFNPDFQDYVTRQVVITVGRQPKKDREGKIIPDEYNNTVTGVKPAGSPTGREDGGLL